MWSETAWDEAEYEPAVNFATGMGGFLQGVLSGYGGVRLRTEELQVCSPRVVPGTTELRCVGGGRAGRRGGQGWFWAGWEGRGGRGGEGAGAERAQGWFWAGWDGRGGRGGEGTRVVLGRVGQERPDRQTSRHTGKQTEQTLSFFLSLSVSHKHAHTYIHTHKHKHTQRNQRPPSALAIFSRFPSLSYRFTHLDYLGTTFDYVVREDGVTLTVHDLGNLPLVLEAEGVTRDLQKGEFQELLEDSSHTHAQTENSEEKLKHLST